MDLNAFKLYSPAIVIVFSVLAFLLALNIYSLIVAVERKEIGTLFAIGYNRTKIRKSYLLGALILGAVGCAMGIGLSLIARNIFIIVYSNALGVPEIMVRIFSISIIKGVIVGFMVSFVSVASPIIKLLYFNTQGLPQKIIKKNSKMKNINLVKGNNFSGNFNNEIIISQDLAEKLQAHIGDTVFVKAHQNKYPLTLVGITAEIMIGQSIISFSKAQEISDSPDEASGIYIKGAKNKDAVKNYLYQKEYVAKVTLKAQLLREFLSIMSEINSIVNAAAGISIFMALLFIYTSTNLTITEREGEYATLMSIGYGKKHITRIILSEITAQGILASLLCIPAAVGVSLFLNHQMGEAWFQVQNHFSAYYFVIVIFPALFLIPAAAYQVMRHIFRLNISRVISLKILE